MRKFLVAITLSLSLVGSGLAANAVTLTQLPTQGFKAADLVLTPTPTLYSGLQVGRTVNVVIGDWDEGVTTTVQWYRDGVAISGATNTSYTVVADDLLHNITAKVTGAKDGSPSVTVTTAPQQPIVGSMTLTPNPKIVGTVQVFKTVTVDIGTWDDGVTTTVQWLRNGQWISGATSTSYTVSPFDTGLPLTVRVSARKTGYSPESKTSDGLYPLLAQYVDRPSPTIAGLFKTGQTLTAQNGTWPEGSMYVYQWLREGYEIPGATESTFALTKADLNFHITVRVNTVTPGYSPTFVTSAGQLVTAGLMNVTRKPSISGSVKVGKTVSAYAGSWVIGAKLAYQWCLDAKPIKGATKSTYMLLPTQKGHKLSLKVTQTATGYLQTTFTTAETKVG
jgi:hypothetical protein